IITNDAESNNFEEQYQELDLRAPADLPEDQKLYRFEGYKVFQLNGPEVTTAEINDPAKSRLVFQTDIRNGVSQIVNWVAMAHPTEPGRLLYEPQVKVLGADGDIRHTFKIVEDQFGRTDRSLVNHKKYYYVAVAYAYNNFDPFD